MHLRLFIPSAKPGNTIVTDSALKYTPINDRHIDLGAKMVPFAGYSMPVQYSGIIDEHHAVRQHAGLFDVSHMGEVWITGPRSLEFIQQLITNDASKLYDGKALYSAMCNEEGGIIDDLLVYRFNESKYMLVINASNIEEDVAWMHKNNSMGVKIDNASDSVGLLALQGPKAFEILKAATGFDASAIKYYHFSEPTSFLGLSDLIVSRTGYTGESGVEIYCSSEDTGVVWDALMTVADEFGLKPAGLGARDTLRLESGFCLHGNDISQDTHPLEAGLGWITKLDKGAFNGSQVLASIKETGAKRRLVGFVIQERGIPRQGYEIQNESGEPIGVVTSGTQSPILSKGVGMGYVINDPAYTAEGATIQVAVRNRVFTAIVTKPPFHK
ncbi:MAG: glycine cleavage system aminomethyltransferase GcvT [Rhodothermales bacterium]|nr:glycine cleavage system aminomethyltransferase GcvT [Rhodothermales bacterium]MDG2017099.1 glycine cleavage system aminomethyltransferase GcvT [Rhodothermales bacterium]